MYLNDCWTWPGGWWPADGEGGDEGTVRGTADLLLLDSVNFPHIATSDHFLVSEVGMWGQKCGLFSVFCESSSDIVSSWQSSFLGEKRSQAHYRSGAWVLLQLGDIRGEKGGGDGE